MAGVGAGEAGGRVMIHWTHSGPSVQPQADHCGQRSADEDEEDEEDDELLAPAPPRERLSYTRYQLELLNGIFCAVRYPNSVQKQLVARRVGISREQVKIWFQNRRRKDVVMSKSSSSGETTDTAKSSPPDPTSPSTSPPSSLPNGGGKMSAEPEGAPEEGREGGKPRMVPEAVVQGCISELSRFSDDKLKERKERRKAKGRRKPPAVSAASSAARGRRCSAEGKGGHSGRLFQAYDMVAPPNTVTPTAALLDTSANRFSHCHDSSAFSSPRHYLAAASPLPRLAWDGALDPGGLGGGGRLGMGVVGGSQSQGVGVGASQDSLPVLSDLLTYRPQGDSAHDTHEASRPPPSLLPPHSPDRDPAKLLDLSSGSSGAMAAPPSPFSRVYPFPFIADPPIILSSLHQHDALHPWPHPPPTPPPPHFSPMGGVGAMDPYKTVRISSLGNPYFSGPPPPPPLPHSHCHWSPQSATDPGMGTSFTQL